MPFLEHMEKTSAYLYCRGHLRLCSLPSTANYLCQRQLQPRSGHFKGQKVSKQSSDSSGYSRFGGMPRGVLGGHVLFVIL